MSSACSHPKKSAHSCISCTRFYVLSDPLTGNNTSFLSRKHNMDRELLKTNKKLKNKQTTQQTNNTQINCTGQLAARLYAAMQESGPELQHTATLPAPKPLQNISITTLLSQEPTARTSAPTQKIKTFALSMRKYQDKLPFRPGGTHGRGRKQNVFPLECRGNTSGSTALPAALQVL